MNKNGSKPLFLASRTDPFRAGTDLLWLRTDPFELKTDPLWTRTDPFELKTDLLWTGTDPFKLRTDPLWLRTDLLWNFYNWIKEEIPPPSLASSE